MEWDRPGEVVRAQVGGGVLGGWVVTARVLVPAENVFVPVVGIGCRIRRVHRATA